MKKLINRILACSIVYLANIAYAHGPPFANIEFSANAIDIHSLQNVDAIDVRIVGDNFSFQKQFTSSNIALDLASIKMFDDGIYHYEITGVKYTGEVQVVNGNGRAPGALMKKSVIKTLRGRFKLNNHLIINAQ